MEKSMLGHAVSNPGLSKHALDGMIDVVKGLEGGTGYTAILKVSKWNRRCALIASAAPKQCVPTAASVAVSMSGPKTGTS
jgi:hypothetical protein